MTNSYREDDSEGKVSTLQAVSLIGVLLVAGVLWNNWFGGAREVRENIEVDLETVGAGWAFHNSLDPVKNKENLPLQAVPASNWQFAKWVYENGDYKTVTGHYIPITPSSENKGSKGSKGYKYKLKLYRRLTQANPPHLMGSKIVWLGSSLEETTFIGDEWVIKEPDDSLEKHPWSKVAFESLGKTKKFEESPTSYNFVDVDYKISTTSGSDWSKDILSFSAFHCGELKVEDTRGAGIYDPPTIVATFKPKS